MSFLKSLPFTRKAPPLREVVLTLEAEAPPAAPDEQVGDELLEASEVDTRALGPLAKVPAFGPAAITVLRMFDRENVAVAQVSRAISSDTAMLSQLLAIANSPLFGNENYITKPDQAIMLLGVQRTKALAATIAMRSLAAGSPKRSLVRRIWRHSVATATVAEAIAPCYGIPPETAHVAGILHDLGRFGMLGAYRDLYAALVTRCHEDVPSILAAEKEACGMDHTRAGSLLGRAWHIPDMLRLAVGLHHDPPEGAELSNLIQTACGLADCFAFPAIAYERCLSIEETIAAYSPADFQAPILARLEGMEQKISDRIVALDF